MPELVCQFFGSPKFVLDGRPVKPDRRKAAALAAFLMVHGKSVARERLADLFWPNFGRTSSLASLRRTLSAMGKVLGKHWFEADREAICFVPNKNIIVDVVQFQALVSRQGANCDALETDILEKIVQMYNGPFLSGFSLDDAPEFDEWQVVRKEALEREFIQAVKRLAQRHETLGNDDRAITHASAWVEVDPLNESAHRCLIRAFGRTGQKGMVKRQYERCRQLLDAELGIPPDPKTAYLAEKALGPGAFPVKQIPASRDLFPEQSVAFIGRHKELAHISTSLIGSSARLLTLTGPGGIGKTRLALEFATKKRASFAHGVFFLPLANISCLDAMMAALSERLGLLPDNRTSVLQQVLDSLREKKILLVLDNLEHLDGVNKQICQLLDNTRHLKILATSRSRLELGREQVLSVPGLDAQAPDLFTAALRRVQPHFTPNAGNVDDIMRVCRLTSAIPLALVLAGGWGDAYCVREIADQIEKSFDFLQAGQADVPPSHRSIRAVFDTSWNSLSQQEKMIFMTLSVFRGAFSREAARTVTGPFDRGPDFRELSGIIRKSLVRLDPVTGLLSLHRLISQYAHEKLLSSGTQEMVLDRHQAYYLDMVRRGEKELIGPKMMACRTDMDLAFANIEQAWLRAVAKKDIASLSSAAAGLYVYFDMHASYLNGRRLFSAAKPLADTIEQPFNPASGLLMVCWFDMHTQSVNSKPSFDQVMGLAHQWLRRSVKSGDDLNRAHALLLMGAVFHKKKAYARAVRLYKQSLSRAPRVEHAFWVTMRIGLCTRALGQTEQALIYFEKSLHIGRDLGDDTKTAWSLSHIGSAHICLGNYDSAIPLFSSAKDIFEQIKALIGVVFCLEELGLTALFQGKFDRAHTLAEQAEALALDAGVSLDYHQRPTALKGMARLMKGDLSRAITCFQDIETAGTPGLTACLGTGFVSILNQDPCRAAFYKKKAEHLAASAHKPQFIALSYLLQAALFLQKNENATAAARLDLAMNAPLSPKRLFNAWPFTGRLVCQIRQS